MQTAENRKRNRNHTFTRPVALAAAGRQIGRQAGV